jgi:AcrR family transcriptional regulator
MATAERRYRGETLAERRRDQRARIMSAAQTAFAEQGFAAASVDEIVAAARVSRTSFYRFFTNKEECLLAIFTEAMEALGRTFSEIASKDASPEEKIRLGAHAIVEGLASDPELARVLLVEVVGATPAIERARLEARLAFARLLEAELRRYPAWRRASSEETELVAVATMAAIAESVSHLVAAGRAAEWESITEPLARFAMRALSPG